MFTAALGPGVLAMSTDDWACKFFTPRHAVGSSSKCVTLFYIYEGVKGFKLDFFFPLNSYLMDVGRGLIQKKKKKKKKNNCSLSLQEKENYFFLLYC